MSIRTFALRHMERIAESRESDFIIGGADNPYLRRWYVIPKNRFLNVYFHHFMRSDDDRALHDHPWCFVSWLLDGQYYEVLPSGHYLCREGSVRFRRASTRHRVQLTRPTPYFKNYPEIPVRTLFITGPRIREWGFWCPKGFKHWKDFTAPSDKGEIGAGCE